MSVLGLFSCSMDASGLGVDGLKSSGLPLQRAPRQGVSAVHGVGVGGAEEPLGVVLGHRAQVGIDGTAGTD